MQRLIVSFFFCLVTGVAFPATITSKTCGPWTKATTWDLNRIPQGSDTIVINSFVAFDTNFVSNSPGILMVAPCGTLCGEHDYNGKFEFKGVVYLRQLTASYGASYSFLNALLNVKLQVTVVNQSTSFTNYSSTCVGCTSTCQNCLTGAKSPNPCITGVPELNIAKLYIFPNPAHDEIFISGFKEKTLLLLIDPLGNLIRESITEENIKFNLTGLLPGIYYLVAKARQGILVSKVIIAKP